MLLFISDLHLSPERPQIVRLFCEFLGKRARTAEGLYILGDLFEYWIGDEAVGQPALAPVIQALRGLTASGVPVSLLHGNRDFLLGEGFSLATGCKILPDPYPIRLGSEDAILMHGDTLCTDDVDYQRFRSQVRDPRWIAAFLAKPVAERIAMAQQYRELSKQATQAKSDEIMDVNGQAVVEILRAHPVRWLIHGHTHRPGRHNLTLDGREVSRIVLGDWYDQGSVLSFDPTTGFHLESLTATAT